MINKNKVKDILEREFNKKIGLKAINKLDIILEEYVKDILKKASKKSDFYGRKIIKENDF